MYSKLEGQNSTMSTLKTKDWFLSLCDFLWSTIVIAPLVVLYWRGSWDLLEDVVFPPNNTTSKGEGNLKFVDEDATEQYSEEFRKQLSGVVCYIGGLLVRIVLDLAKFHVGEFLRPKSKYVRVTFGRLYNAIYALAGVSFWRGVWFLMKLDVGLGTVQLLVVLIGSLAVLIFTKVPKSLISSPLAICLDQHEITFSNGTFFRKTPETGCWFLIDVIFTNLIIRQFIVFCWWSLWSLENQFLLPKDIGEKDKLVSYDSLLMGYGGAIITFSFNRLIKDLTTTKLYITKPLSSLITVLAFFSSVNVWRGLWSMLDHYFLPSINQDENYIIGHVAGLTVLMCLLVSNTICNDMIVLDSETESAVNIEYWKKTASNKEQEEMVPIIE